MNKNEEQVIRLDRDAKDHLLPKSFFEIIAYRFFPVIGLVYFSSVISLSMHKGDFFHYITQETSPYLKSILIVVWVSIPSVIWIALNASSMFRPSARLWYKVIAALQVISIALSYVLFPEAGMFGLRQYFAISIPVFIIVYLFFVRNWLPDGLAMPLNLLGGLTFAYGCFIKVLY